MTSLNNELESVISRVIDEEMKTKNGQHVFPRDDDVLFAEYMQRQLSSAQEPCVWSDDAFWVYGKDGCWKQLDISWMKRQVMQLSGARIFKKKIEKGEDENGKPIYDVETKPLNLWAGKIKGITECLQVLLSQPDFFSAPVPGLLFQNGFVEVGREARVLPPAPHHRARWMLPFTYRDHPCPRWQGFLNDIFRDDEDREEKKLVLQEFIGAALCGAAVVYEKSLILLGEGSNGKSVLLDVLQSLFPEKAITSVAPQQFEHEYYRARLYGSVLNVVSEMPRRELVDTPAFNAVISGDRIDARRPAGQPFEFRARAAHIFAVNPPLPSTAEMARGFWRRFIILSFNRSFERDPMARDKKVLVRELIEEAPGIAYWAIEGAKRLAAQQRYTQLASSEQHLRKWRETADQVSLFIAARCERLSVPEGEAEREIKLKHAMPTEDLYSSYRSWAEKTGHQRLMTLHRFAERLDLLKLTVVQVGGALVRPLRLIDSGIDRARTRAHAGVDDWPTN